MKELVILKKRKGWEDQSPTYDQWGVTSGVGARTSEGTRRSRGQPALAHEVPAKGCSPSRRYPEGEAGNRFPPRSSVTRRSTFEAWIKFYG